MTDTPDPYRELREAATGAAVCTLNGQHLTVLRGIWALPILALLAERDEDKNWAEVAERQGAEINRLHERFAEADARIVALLAERDRLARDERAGGDTAAEIIATMRTWPSAAQIPAPLSEAARLIGPVRRETEHLMTVLHDLLDALRKSEERAGRLVETLQEAMDALEAVQAQIVLDGLLAEVVDDATEHARAALAKEATDGK